MLKYLLFKELGLNVRFKNKKRVLGFFSPYFFRVNSYEKIIIKIPCE